MDAIDQAQAAEQDARDVAQAQRYQHSIKHGPAHEAFESSKAEDQAALAEFDAMIADHQDAIKELRKAKNERFKGYREKRKKGPEDLPLIDGAEKNWGSLEVPEPKRGKK